MKKTISWRLGACVRRLRTEQGYTQVDFAERCGFYQTYVSRLETGKANPTLNAIEVMATALGMDVFQLFEVVRSDAERRRS